MELRQAIADLAEVRGRLATVQRFEGYSGWAAITSGLVAVAAGVVQFALIPAPRTLADQRLYLDLWLTCLALALAINYGAIVAWYVRHRSAHVDVQVRTVGMSIAPAVAAGGVITIALVSRGLYGLLPGMWCATYALGLFASRAMVPRNVVAIAVAFGAFAAFLLLSVRIDTMSWWVMPLAFGCGQIAIGAMVRTDDRSRAGVTP
ncbi:MAG: hypothetical protein ACREM6_08280 [Vulcanimicrobiaceae bacterium]